MSITYVTDTVTSRDGTTIGYRQLGDGPGVVLLHGGVESAQSHVELAEQLADSHTVYLPDRRGRGMSGPFGTDYTVDKDVEDMDALLTRTGAGNVFGISSAAIIWLHAMRVVPAIRKAVLYEPPLSVDGMWSGGWTPQRFLTSYSNEIAAGKVASAMALGLKVTQMGPPVVARMPHWLLQAGTALMMRSEDKKAKPGDVTTRILAPTLRYDTQLIIESEGKLETFAETSAEVMLMGGEVSPDYLKRSMKALTKVFPSAPVVIISGASHGGSGNKNRGGKPEIVAKELQRFFGAKS